MGRIFAIPEQHGQAKMGLQLPESLTSDDDLKIRFRIRSGDPDGFFKAESHRVGDFVFLVLRTRTNSRDVLNRERRDKYVLDVRARIRRRDRRRDRRRASKKSLNTEQEPRVKVRVLVTDTNDLDPFFQPSHYSFTVDEDAPLHSSVGRIRATDADLGVNGQIYYSMLGSTDDNSLDHSDGDNDDATSHFAVDPVSGNVFVTRQLDFKMRPRYSLSVAAQDRGAKPAYAARQADTARVDIQVKQVRIKILIY